jgi:hypothetical protein
MKEPFSYYVGAKSFGNHDALWNLEGKNVFTFSEKSLKDGTQGGGKANSSPSDQHLDPLSFAARDIR